MKKREPLQLRREMDNLSNLPEHVIDQILIRMSIRDAVRTSVLSTNWRYKWTTIPHLVFSNECVPISSWKDESKLINIVDRALLFHNGPIHMFELSHCCLQGVSDIGRWILYLSRKSIKDFILRLAGGQRFKVPTSLFSCESLVYLSLCGCLLKPPSKFKGFKNLKCLDLQNITMSQDVFESLITSCPMLERLMLTIFDGFSHLNIDAPNLTSVDITGDFSDIDFKNTFHLAFVSIDLYEIVENEQTLVSRGSSSELLRFFVHLPSIRTLWVGSDFLKYLAFGNVPEALPHPCIVLNHLYFEINFDDVNESLVVLCLLRSSPNLQELEILATLEETGTGSLVEFLNRGDNWNSTLVKLREVKLFRISGTKPQFEFINFLLSNSPVLERMTIESASVDGRCKLMKELLSSRKASMATKIIFLDPKSSVYLEW